MTFISKLIDFKNGLVLKAVSFFSAHGLFFEEASVNKVREYLIDTPKVYSHFLTMRFDGVASYVVKRELTSRALFYVRKGKEKTISNAKYLVYNYETEDFVLDMKFNIRGFLFNPPYFNPSFWVCDGISHCVNFIQGKEALDFTPHGREEVIDFNVNLKYYRYVHRFSDYDEKERLLKATYDRTLNTLEEEAAKYQEECTGIKDSLKLSDTYIVYPNVICPICAKPAIKAEHSTERCICNCGAAPVKVSSTVWMKSVQSNREELNKLSNSLRGV